MIITEEEHLIHYGTLRKSGRYPWGSGDNVEQQNKSFLDHVQKLKEQGLTEVQIAEGMGITTSQLRNYKSIARAEHKQAQIDEAQKLKDKNWSNVAIGKKMGINESSVRALLAPGAGDKNAILAQTVAMLKDEVADKKYLDVGAGVEAHLSISYDKLKTAIAVLKDEGYKIHYFKTPQVGNPGKFTSLKILTKDDVTGKEMYANLENIKIPGHFSTDGGRTWVPPSPPLNISSKRVAVRYAEQGGKEADGLIYVRPGVKDISLGNSRYAQVRVGVDGTHFLKGMAVYKDDLPDGVDLMFNTNKSDTGNKLDAMKKQEKDPDLPFGAITRPLTERDSKGVERTVSVMNIVNEEGNWDDWSRNLSAQMLSKQSPLLVKAQLDKTYAAKAAGLDEIMSLTNPAVRKKLLQEYSDDVDSSAVHLKAASMERQATKVILPISSIKPTEIYAPSFRDGEQVVLIRYPHGGIFEIPELTVNNRNREAKKIIGTSKDAREDAVGIHWKTAEKLSGADFDGDTVLVIPNPNGAIKTAPTLAGLKNFDAKAAYPKYDGMIPMTEKTKGTHMGNISNLITDMTIRGATADELARAVRHSMVVIDAPKHELNYKQSAINNGISDLKRKYQSDSKGLGASTLISRAGSEQRVRERKDRPDIDPETGKKIWRETGAHWVDEKGKVRYATQASTKLAETDDAFTLSSGTPVETLYATHSNKLKALANTARKEMVATKTTPYSPSARAAYSKEVASLDAKLNIAKRNAPLERQAQLLANTVVSAKRKENPGLEEAELKKIKSQALTTARNRTGASKTDIFITDSEWAAIQAGAISNNKLTQILNKADTDRVKKLAMPKTTVLMSSSKRAKAARLLASGYTQAEVADALGVSLTTLKTSIAEG